MTWFGRGRLLAALCAWVVASCGGGGGGGDGGSGSSLTVSSDRSSLQFVVFDGTPPVGQTIRFTILNGSGTYYGSVQVDRPNEFAVDFVPTGGAAADVTLTPYVSASQGAHSGTMTFRLCSDEACNRPVWSKQIPYTVRIYAANPLWVDLVGYEGAAAVTRSVVLTPADGTEFVATAPTTGNAGWLSLSRGVGGSIDIAATGSAVPPGSYQAEVKVTIAGLAGGPVLTIPVRFTVGNAIVAPAPAAVDVVYDSTWTSLKRQVAIGFNGTQSPAWQATADQPWLVLTQPSGTGAGNLEYTIDTNQLQSLPNWQSATAQVTLRAGTLTPASFTVTVNKKLPQLHLAAPDTVVAARAGQTLRVFGRGLSQLPSAAWILVDNQPASGSIVSDTQALLSLPALAAGNVTLRVPNLVSTDARNAAVTAAPLGALGYATAANAGEKRSALFDPSRNAVYAVNWTQNTLVRYRRVGSQWTVDGLPVAQIGDLALAPDRSALYVGSGSTQLLEVDPDTLQLRATHTLQPGAVMYNSIAVGAFRTRGMPITNDLRLWFGGSQWTSANYFDLQRGIFGYVVGASTFNDLFYSPLYFGPADGSRLVVSQNGLSPMPPTALYNAAGAYFSTTALALPPVYYAADWSGDGTKLLIDDASLHDGGSGALLGSVQPGNPINLGSVLSRDGTRIYTIVTANNGSTTPDHVNVYDATQVTPGTSVLVKLGEIALPDLALDCGSQPPYGCDLRGAFLIGPLGDTLFWLGNQRLVVLPVPQALSGANAVKRLLPALRR